MKLFARRSGPARSFDIPQGAFTYDSAGGIVVGSVPTDWLEAYGPQLVSVFRKAFTSAEQKGLPLAEIALHYAGARITARDLRGGGIVYVFPVRKQP